MNQHMTTAHSIEIDSQILMDPDPRTGIWIRDPGSGSDPDPVFLKTGIRIRIRIRSETDRMRNTDFDNFYVGCNIVKWVVIFGGIHASGLKSDFKKCVHHTGGHLGKKWRSK